MENIRFNSSNNWGGDCPLCKEKAEFKQILMLKNVFSSGDIFEFEAMKKIGEKGYARGDCIMDLRQCNQCGVLYNFAFDISKMLKAYSNKAYYQQKILHLV